MNNLNDLLIFQVDAESGKRSQIDVSFGSFTKSVQGIQKLSQWVVMGLLTRLGSSSHDPSWGTDLIGSLLGRGGLDQDRAQELFSRAAQQLLQYQAENLEDGRPDDEVLEATELIKYSQVGDKIDLRIRVLSSAGEEREFEMPVSRIV